MSLLAFEIWAWLLAMALAGFGVGWLVWGYTTSRRERYFERRLARAERNWDEVEARLATELDRVAALERERTHLREELERLRAGALREPTIEDGVSQRGDDHRKLVAESRGRLGSARDAPPSGTSARDAGERTGHEADDAGAATLRVTRLD